jgi:hypothetical protein
VRIERRDLLGRSLIILAAILAMVAILARMLHRANPGRPYAQAVANGAAVARTLTDDDAGDQNLRDDEVAAGAMWARQNHPASAADCPRYSVAFRKGCADQIATP